MSTLADSEERLFTARRIWLFGSLLVLLNIALLTAVGRAGGWFVGTDGSPTAIDFSFFWVSGRFAISSHPAGVYDYEAFSAAQRALYGVRPGGFPPYHFIYPPIFMLFTWSLGLLPYFAAFAAWICITFLLYLAAVCAVVPRTVTIVAAAAPIAVLHNAQAGHNGFLTAGLLGLSLLAMERRPVIAGVLLGLLAYKPQFGLLLPFALAAGRQWRVMSTAALTVLGLGLLAALLFGADVWPAYIATVRNLDGRLSPDPQQVELLHQSVFGILHWLGAGFALAWGAHAIAALLIACLVCFFWFQPIRHALKAAALCVGVVATTPYVLGYDLCILSLAVAFFVQDGLAHGFRPGERAVLLLCFLGSVAAFWLRWPAGPVVYFALLALVARRAAAATDAIPVACPG